MPLAFSQMPSVIPGFSIIVDNGVRGVKRAGLGRTKKQTEPLPYRLFPGSGALLIHYTRSLERIDRRFQFGYEFKKLKTDRVAARCRRRLWRQSQNSLDSPAIAVIFKRSSLDGEQVHGINWSPACHILKHFPNFLSP
jgi:hypothetical protein